jgi:hypothetical protein
MSRESPGWAANLAADARRMLDEVDLGLDRHTQIRAALEGVGAQPHLDQGECTGTTRCMRGAG